MPLFAIGERRVQLLGEHHYVAHDATLVGDITLHNDVSVWFKVVIRAENDRITIGEGCNIQDASVLHVDPGYPMTLGRNVSVGHKVMLHGCTIGDGSLIGINSVIMNGARIGRGCLIGANTLIAEGKEIPEGRAGAGLAGQDRARAQAGGKRLPAQGRQRLRRTLEVLQEESSRNLAT